MRKVNKTGVEHIASRLRMPPLVCGDTPYEALRTPDADRWSTGLPLVSVVTVTFNAAATLENAILSVANQTYPGPIEFIIIDGGSTDGTLDVIARHHQSIDCLISEPDNGIYDAMNKGLRRARGVYVALLNADDRFGPDFLSESVQQLERTGADISYCGHMAGDEEVLPGHPGDGLLFNHQGFRHNTFLHRRSCFELIGGFDINLKVIADAKWFRAAYLSNLCFVRVQGIHFFYSMGGVSDASTPAQRGRMIEERVALSLRTFDVLDADAARKIYLSNFNPSDAYELCDLHVRFQETCPLLSEALAQTVRWNIRHSEGYIIGGNHERLDQLLALVDHFDVPLDALRVRDNGSAACETLAQVLLALAAMQARKDVVCLHFAKVFSTETETFIHDLLGDLAEDEPEVVHVMLCDRRINAEVRPWPHVLTVPWEALDPRLARRLYVLIWARLAPARVVAHFAINGWVLHNRLDAAQRQVPWLNMCHGIDVFTLNEKEDYGAWVREYCALAPNVGFTAVSGFLRRLLIESGVPENRVTLVPNAISEKFFANRKMLDFWRPGRPLRILSVGRLIQWKGQDILLRALAILRENRPDVSVHVTFVYGQEERELPKLQALADEFGLSESVSFEPFIDFRAKPEVIAKFDLFVLPSTLSSDKQPRTETFGVAILEAMSAGLPVIGTDAGGIPEVMGEPDAQACIVPHGDPQALADALLHMIETGETVFAPNEARALDRTRRFAPQVRLGALREAWAKVMRPRKRIVHFCALTEGGAAQASLNIHRGFLQRDYDSIFVTRKSDNLNSLNLVPNVVALAPELSVGFDDMAAPKRPGFTMFTLDDEPISDATLCAVVAGADLINIAWPGHFLSAGNIATLSSLGVPVVLMLRDMRAITGGCHYFHGCNGWQMGCEHCPQTPLSPSGGFESLSWRVKKEGWYHPAITFAALSDHSLKTLRNSPLVDGVRCIKLPNIVQTEAFRPDPAPLEGMEEVPPGLRIGYLPSFDSRIKGHDLLMEALRRLRVTRPDIDFVLVAVSGAVPKNDNVPFPVYRLPRLQGTTRLRQFYNSVDIVAVPSLEETFSNTCVEAMACGTPVVGFQTGILTELLDDGRFGVAVPVGSVDALTTAFEDVATRKFDRDEISRSIATLFGPRVRMNAYQAAFEALMEQPPARREMPAAVLGLRAQLDCQRATIKANFIRKRLASMKAAAPSIPLAVKAVVDSSLVISSKNAQSETDRRPLTIIGARQVFRLYRQAGRSLRKHLGLLQ